MALLKLSGIITKISGKIGGSILGTSNNGSYIKQNSYGQQNASPQQSKQRQKIGLITQGWRSLTITQQNLWKADVSNYPYVNRVGDTVNYTGYQLFNYINLNLKVVNVASRVVPAAFVASFTPTVTMSALYGGDFTYIFTANAANQSMILYYTRPLKNNLVPKESDYLNFVYFNMPAGNPQVNIWGLIILQFPSLMVGDIMWSYVVSINKVTGIRGVATIPIRSVFT